MLVDRALVDTVAGARRVLIRDKKMTQWLLGDIRKWAMVICERRALSAVKRCDVRRVTASIGPRGPRGSVRVRRGSATSRRTPASGREMARLHSDTRRERGRQYCCPFSEPSNRVQLANYYVQLVQIIGFTSRPIRRVT